nr:MAG TPA: hypothetical protein [Caudoviricetes sp.]
MIPCYQSMCNLYKLAKIANFLLQSLFPCATM